MKKQRCMFMIGILGLIVAISIMLPSITNGLEIHQVFLNETGGGYVDYDEFDDEDYTDWNFGTTEHIEINEGIFDSSERPSNFDNQHIQIKEHSSVYSLNGDDAYLNYYPNQNINPIKEILSYRFAIEDDNENTNLYESQITTLTFSKTTAQLAHYNIALKIAPLSGAPNNFRLRVDVFAGYDPTVDLYSYVFEKNTAYDFTMTEIIPNYYQFKYVKVATGDTVLSFSKNFGTTDFEKLYKVSYVVSDMSFYLDDYKLERYLTQEITNIYAYTPEMKTQYYQNEQISIIVEVNDTHPDLTNVWEIKYKFDVNSNVSGSIFTDENGIGVIQINQLLSICNETVMIWHDANDNDLRESNEIFAVVQFNISAPPSSPSKYPKDVDVEIDKTKYNVNEPIIVRIYTSNWDIGVNKSNLEIKGRLKGDFKTDYVIAYTNFKGDAILTFVVDESADDVYVEVFEEGGLTTTSDHFSIISEEEAVIETDEPLLDEVIGLEIGNMSIIVIGFGIVGVVSTMNWLGLSGRVMPLQKYAFIKGNWALKYGLIIGAVAMVIAVIWYVIG